jgi:hypothetical protein
MGSGCVLDVAPVGSGQLHSSAALSPGGDPGLEELCRHRDTNYDPSATAVAQFPPSSKQDPSVWKWRGPQRGSSEAQ